MRSDRWRIAFFCLLAVAVYSLVAPRLSLETARGASTPDETQKVHGFSVEIEGLDGYDPGCVESVAGVELVTAQPSNNRRHVGRRFAGSTEVSNIILRLRATHPGTTAIWKWYSARVESQEEAGPRMVHITLSGVNGEQVVRYSLSEAVPCAWRGPGLSAGNAAPRSVYEQVELSVVKVERSAN